MYVFRLFDKADPLNPVDARMLREGLLRIGRDSQCDWVVADPDCEISRAHCELRADPDGLVLRSTGANGTFDEASGARLPDDAEVRLELPQSIAFGRYRMTAEFAPDVALDEGAGGRTMVTTAPFGETVDVPNDWIDAAPVPPVLHEGSLLEAFCEGAGLDASAFSAEDPVVIMRRAGAVYRQMLLGVGDLMTERDRARQQSRLVQTMIGSANNNPFKWAPTQRLAIDLLLQNESSFLSGPDALKASFGDIKRHLISTFAGFRAALGAAVTRFDPAALRQAAEARATLLKGRPAAAMEEVEARHADLVRELEQGEHGLLDRAFVEAYQTEAVELGRRNR